MRELLCLLALSLIGCAVDGAAPSPAALDGGNHSWEWCEVHGSGGTGVGWADGFLRTNDGGSYEEKVDVANDPGNCGSCSYFCWDELGAMGADPHKQSAILYSVDYQCARGQCVFACREGLSDCDKQRSNGCEQKGTCP